MREFTKAERRQMKDILKVGILRRHAEWQNKLKALLDEPLAEDENEFSRSMQITDMARKFYKEAMKMEDYYRTSLIESGIIYLLMDGYLLFGDFSVLSEDLRAYFQSRLKIFDEE